MLRMLVGLHATLDALQAGALRILSCMTAFQAPRAGDQGNAIRSESIDNLG